MATARSRNLSPQLSESQNPDSQTSNSQSITEFCEQVDPRILLEMRRRRPFPETVRIQQSWVATAEKRALLWLTARTPEWIGPDHLTVLGLVAQVSAGAC